MLKLSFEKILDLASDYSQNIFERNPIPRGKPFFALCLATVAAPFHLQAKLTSTQADTGVDTKSPNQLPTKTPEAVTRDSTCKESESRIPLLTRKPGKRNRVRRWQICKP
jgi:hypothetical protein